VLDDYAVDVSLNGQPSATNIAFNSGSRPFGDPPNPFGNYSELVGLSVSGSNYLCYTLSGSSFFGLTFKGGSPVLDYSLELSFVYRPAPTVIPKLSVFSRSASVQFEGNSGLTHYIFTIHRNGLTSGVTTVGWAIAGAGGNPATTNDFAPGSTLSGVLTFLPTETEKQIDDESIAPGVTNVVFGGHDGRLALGEGITLTVTFNRAVVAGTGVDLPGILLNNGGRAGYVSGSGTNQLVFSYIAAAGQSTPALATANANALAGTIQDLAGNAVVSSGFNNRRPTGTLRVDTLAPTITGFAFSRNSGSLPLGTTLTLTVTFSETVVVPGSTALLPSLLLNSGGRATYVSGSGTNKLIFTHTITKGQLSSALATATTNALSGAIRDLTGNAVVSSGFNNRKPTGILMVDTRPRQLTIAQTRDGHEQGAVTAVFTLSRTGPRSSPLTVAYTLGGSATPGSDYSGAGAGTVTFPVGSDTTTLTLPVADDSEAEGEELIIARITAPVGYTLVPGFEKADALLIDNDPVTGLAGGAPMPLKASLSPFAAAPTLATPTPATPLLQHTPWAGGMDLEPMQAVSPLAILRVAEPPA
jgi:hypothetical protein